MASPFEEIVNTDIYEISGTPGQGQWAIVPSLSIFNKNITTSAQKGYYVVYLFKENMKGVYLSLNFGVTEFKKKYGKNKLVYAAKNFRELLKDEFEEIQNYKSLDLENREGKSKNGASKDYEDGDIFNIYYAIDDLDSDEKLINDLNLFLKMYDYLYEKCRGVIFTDNELSEDNDDHIIEITPPQTSSKYNFSSYLHDRNFFFDSKTIENYLLSLKVKPFIILTGNSGTGKTKISQLFAEYLEGDIKDNHVIVPVGANWTENRNIVGYYNVLTKSYQHTPSLDLFLNAKDNEDEPYFLILDEMNLSHVERYFSDFLSAMESNKPIPLHKANTEYGGNVPEELKIPENVFIVGTVNVDETTYMFSPKVLDRANVLEFKTFDKLSMVDYIKNKHDSIEFKGDVNYLENVLSDINLRDNVLDIINEEFVNVQYIDTNKVLENDGTDDELESTEIKHSVLETIASELSQFNEYLEGSGFEFGYRTVNEILSFMYVAWKYEHQLPVWNNWKRYLDAQILQKILPKIHGSQMVLGETLDNLLLHCLGLESIDDIPELKNIDNSYPYPDSAKKLIQMKEVLEKQRYVSFIN